MHRRLHQGPFSQDVDATAYVFIVVLMTLSFRRLITHPLTLSAMQTQFGDKKARRSQRKKGMGQGEEAGMVFALSTGVGNAVYRDAIIDELCRRAVEKAANTHSQ